MSLHAIIFDVDGTLADTEEAHREAFNSAFTVFGLDWNWSRPRYADLLATAGGKERIAVHLDSLDLSATEGARLREEIPAIHRLKTAHYTRILEEGRLPLREGIARLIEECRRAEIRLAIASTTTPANVEALLLATLGAQSLHWFDAIAAGDAVRHKKPAPDIFRLALAQLKEDPSDCVAIEDSAKGVAAAKGAGLFTVATPCRWTQSEDFSAADLVLPSLGSPAYPLAAAAAERIGNTMLRVADLEKILTQREFERGAA